MIKRTSDEMLIANKVNISASRAFFPDTKRCLNPDLNPEKEKTFSKKQGQPEQQKIKQGNFNPISSIGPDLIDLRAERKRAEKVDLINNYENNQETWGSQTNHFVNKLKTEVNYEPDKDFVFKEEPISSRLQAKLDIMQQQCITHKENMMNNPVTGNRKEPPKPKGKKYSEFGDFNNNSDIHMLTGKGMSKEVVESGAGKKKFEQRATEGVIQREVSPHRLRRTHREEYSQQRRLESRSASSMHLGFGKRETVGKHTNETDRNMARRGSISPRSSRVSHM